MCCLRPGQPFAVRGWRFAVGRFAVLPLWVRREAERRHTGADETAYRTTANREPKNKKPPAEAEGSRTFSDVVINQMPLATMWLSRSITRLL